MDAAQCLVTMRNERSDLGRYAKRRIPALYITDIAHGYLQMHIEYIYIYIYIHIYLYWIRCLCCARSCPLLITLRLRRIAFDVIRLRKLEFVLSNYIIYNTIMILYGRCYPAKEIYFFCFCIMLFFNAGYFQLRPQKQSCIQIGRIQFVYSSAISWL